MPKILAVDDSVTMRRILEMTFIGQDGIQVVTADGGDSGLRAVDGADLIIVDVSMPGMTGYDFARAARGNGASAPILLLASEHHPIDAEKLRASGADDHVLKPFETQALIDKAKDLIAKGGKGVAAPAGVPAPPRPVAPAAPAVAAPRPVAPAPAAPVAPARPAAPIPGVVAAPRPAAPAAPVAPVAAASAPAPSQPRSATASFGAPPGSRPPTAAMLAPQPAAGPRPPTSAQQPVPLVAKKAEPAAPVASAAVSAASAEMEGKLSGMGLTPAQIEGVLALSREVIERVVWEVVPDLAETIIREEIKRLTS
ncbi:MAG: response regulator [Sandaracinus sp.]